MLIDYGVTCDSVWKEILHRKEVSIRNGDGIHKIVLSGDEYCELLRELPNLSSHSVLNTNCLWDNKYLGHFMGVALYFGVDA